jgi:hypothetical protein
MDDDIRKILEKVFTVEDLGLIEEMLKVVNRNISDSQSRKRINELDELICGVGND